MQLQKQEIFHYLHTFSLLDESGHGHCRRDGATVADEISVKGRRFRRFTNEFWTSRQRQSHSIHEISYRACFKAQLPRFFIELLTEPGDLVYDPFSGRGTTAIEAAILKRRVISNDINPLSRIMASPRLAIPDIGEIEGRLGTIAFDRRLRADMDLSMFYHPATESEIVSLKQYLQERKSGGEEDAVDRWIRMAATSRLTGHSSGFFSVYTLPPNQAVSPESQRRINLRREQAPDYRHVKKLILRKSISLLRNLTPPVIANLREASGQALFLENDARSTGNIESGSVHLTVTSPPFLDIVQYSSDNWLRCWFNDLEAGDIEKKMTVSRTVEEWSLVMGELFTELYRITRAGGWVAFEVGEVKKGKIKLEEYVLPLGLAAGFKCAGVIINKQEFTKTSNIWGINNNRAGTNTNRIVLFCKDG